MKVAVTGAGGQIGSIIIEEIGKVAELTPVAIFRNRIGSALYESNNFDSRIVDLENLQDCIDKLSDCEAVINCAIASGTYKEARLTNVSMVKNLLKLPNLKYFMHLSTVAVYGDAFIVNGLNTYDDPRPNRSYGKEKLHVETEIIKNVSNKTSFYILRLGHVYGCEMAFSKAILSFLTDKNFRIPYQGEKLSNTVYVGNIASGIINLLKDSIPSGIYNLSDNPHLTWAEIFSWHCTATGLPMPKAIDTNEADRINMNYRNYYKKSLASSVFMDFSKWIGSLPYLNLLKSDSFQRIAYFSLIIMPDFFEKWVRKRYAKWSAQKSVSLLSLNKTITSPFWLFSDSMPGKYLLNFTNNFDSNAITVKMKKWYENYKNF
ncbi:MAG: hypothetical protein DKM50_04760 [Candidatus Margulisiibacteriota bacterium]|nr:MAG: hypothetical protein DKM50_04760 [Candidatus Margulisiibacteriota bacterium]